MKEKIVFSLKILIILSIIALTGLVYFQQGDFTSLDLGRHLKNGQIIWSQPEALYKNLYSYTEPNFPFVNHHWFAGVIFWWLYLIGGFKILGALNVVLGILTALIIFKLAVRQANFWLAGILILPVILLLSERVDIRPEMFSYVLLALTYYLVEDFRAGGWSKKLLWLAPIFLIWANLHIYFFLGLFLISLTLTEQLILYFKAFFKMKSARQFLYLTLFSWAAASLNPNFIKGLIYPFNILKKYGYEIVENKSPFYLETLMIDDNILLFKILLGLLIVSFILFFAAQWKGRWLLAASQSRLKQFLSLNFFNLAGVLFFSTLAGLYIRNLPIFGLMALPVLAKNFYQASFFWRGKLPPDGGRRLKINSQSLARGADEVNGQKAMDPDGRAEGKFFNQPSAWFLMIFLAYVLAFAFLLYDQAHSQRYLKRNLGLGMNQQSLNSIKFYQANNLSGPIFNNYDLGSALIFWLYPGERVFLDNRPEAYSQEFFSRVYKPMMQDQVQWQELSEKYKINSIYFSHTDGTPWAREFLAARFHDENWPLIYFDDYAVIMIKNSEANGDLIKKRKIGEQEFAGRLNELLAKAAVNEKMNLANLSALYGRPDLAESIYQAILTARPDDGRILAALGYLYSGGQLADTQKSIQYLTWALNNGYVLPAIYNQQGLNYWNLTDYGGAIKMWQKALKFDSGNEHAKDYLKQANELIK